LARLEVGVLQDREVGGDGGGHTLDDHLLERADGAGEGLSLGLGEHGEDLVGHGEGGVFLGLRAGRERTFGADRLRVERRSFEGLEERLAAPAVSLVRPAPVLACVLERGSKRLFHGVPLFGREVELFGEREERVPLAVRLHLGLPSRLEGVRERYPLPVVEQAVQRREGGLVGGATADAETAGAGIAEAEAAADEVTWGGGVCVGVDEPELHPKDKPVAKQMPRKSRAETMVGGKYHVYVRNGSKIAMAVRRAILPARFIE
jgi:hypothetical protein